MVKGIVMGDWVERYADTANAVLAAELGVGLRTLVRWASKMGLRKSDAFLREVSRKGLMEIEYRRLCGERVGGFRKGDGHKGTAGSFRKGHRFEREIEEKRVKALRERAWDERRRALHGMEAKTRWPVARDLKKL